MNKIPVFIFPLIGMVGVMMLPVWFEGVMLQPMWVQSLTAFAAGVFWCRVIFQHFTTDEGFRFSLPRFAPTLLGIVIIPLFTAVFTGAMSEVVMFGNSEPEPGVEDLLAGTLSMQMAPYLSVPFLIWTISIEFIHPLWSLCRR
ncbi:hypothetical protein MNZ66_004668 [Salmonella enterica]|nr:hypothetical protein [Salmonella enterica]EJO8074304.1 hypothetical protein [Salmonella enterica]